MLREVPKDKKEDRIEVEAAKKEKKSDKEQEMVTIKKVCINRIITFLEARIVVIVTQLQTTFLPNLLVL